MATMTDTFIPSDLARALHEACTDMRLVWLNRANAEIDEYDLDECIACADELTKLAHKIAKFR